MKAEDLNPSQLGTAVHSLLDMAMKRGRNPHDFIGQKVVYQWADDNHAKLSPSGAKRWLNCPGSVKYIEQEAQPTTTLKVVVTKSMANSAEVGFDAIWPVFSKAEYKGSETRVAIPVTGEYGTVDDWAVPNTNTLDVWDYKNGRNEVAVKKNVQEMLYTHGLLHTKQIMRLPITKVRLHIVQPNAFKDHPVDTWVTTPKAINDWVQYTVKPVVKSIRAGTGMLIPGDHCRDTRCPHAGKCTALARMMGETVRTTFKEFITPAKKAPKLPEIGELTPAEISVVLSRLPMWQQFFEGVQKEGMKILLKSPKVLPDWKLVESRTKRRWSDEQRVMKKLKLLGFEYSEFAPRKLAGLGDVAKLLEPADRQDFLDTHTVKPNGRPQLAKASDPRPRIQSNAKLDFASDIEEDE